MKPVAPVSAIRGAVAGHRRGLSGQSRIAGTREPPQQRPDEERRQAAEAATCTARRGQASVAAARAARTTFRPNTGALTARAEKPLSVACW